MNCVRCGKEINWDDVVGEFVEVFDQADRYGMEALTDEEQTLVNGGLCTECFNGLL